LTVARKQRSDQLRQAAKRIQRAARAVADAARTDTGPDAKTVNIAHRTNVVVNANVNEPGATTIASVEQYAPIRQQRRPPSQASDPDSTQSPGGESNHGA
jgi:metal-dependent amidase/aminoacylase/carboxypeptidase family protein